MFEVNVTLDISVITRQKMTKCEHYQLTRTRKIQSFLKNENRNKTRKNSNQFILAEKIEYIYLDREKIRKNTPDWSSDKPLNKI